MHKPLAITRDFQSLSEINKCFCRANWFITEALPWWLEHASKIYWLSTDHNFSSTGVFSAYSHSFCKLSQEFPAVLCVVQTDTVWLPESVDGSPQTWPRRWCLLAVWGRLSYRTIYFQLRRLWLLANTKHLYNIYTMLDQRRRRWADVV